MSLHHLDPRQAGVTEPEVDVYRRGHGWQADWGETGDAQGDTEAAALRAARESAGFGHVAEQPCDEYQPLTRSMVAVGAEIGDECRYCAWPRDRHGKGRLRC